MTDLGIIARQPIAGLETRLACSELRLGDPEARLKELKYIVYKLRYERNHLQQTTQ